MRVELVYDKGCPNVAATRANLLRAFAAARLEAKWAEWERSSPASPAYVARFGSPSILVDGFDVEGDNPTTSVSRCRLYASAEGRYSGTPAVELIEASLRRADLKVASAKTTGTWKQSLFALPGVAMSILPFGGCPACWPLYAGVLSTLGYGFLLSSAYLLPLTSLFLFFSVVVLAYRARSRRGYGPSVLGLIAAILILWGKFPMESNVVAYAGVGLLISSSIWNSWPRPAARVCAVESYGEIIMAANKRNVEVFSAGCPACSGTVSLVQQIACSSCEVEVLDMNKPEVVAKARQYGVKTVPAVAINGKLAGCCNGAGPNEAALRSAGLGVAT